MEHIVNTMMEKYRLKTAEQNLSAFKEVVQEIGLSALSRTDFFEKAAFYGGTALRIFYGLNRFSEDLDFSLEMPDRSFDISRYFHTLETTFSSFGLSFQTSLKEKTSESTIQSAFLKGNTAEHIFWIQPNPDLAKYIQKNEVIKIKIEIDINPPSFASYEYKYGLLPQPYRVRLYDRASLFSGKIHAILCREWKNRVKGRDLYDFVFFLSGNSGFNLKHLESRLRQSCRWNLDREMTTDDVRRLLKEKFLSIDYSSARADVINFITDPRELDLWGADFFLSLTDRL